MDNILNITNGDSAVNIMRLAGIPGVFLPWQDVLHDGPVPDNQILEKLSSIRARFIADCGWGKFAEINKDFIQRDNQLKTYHHYEKIILWFEHDLYDQLQILQILDWLQQNPAPDTELSIVCTDQYLGTQTPSELAALLEFEQPINRQHLQLATKAWAAFRSSNPEKWAELLNDDTSALPFLQGTILRLLEQYPSTLNGLSRTAHKALELIYHTQKRPEEIFQLYQQTEERRFLGDLSFWMILNDFLQSAPPLITQLATKAKTITIPSAPKQTLSMTAAGEEVLAGKANWLEIAPLDHWIGGVHLTTNNVWYWNARSHSLNRTVNLKKIS